MQYNFDELTERRNTGCVKWDSDNDPMEKIGRAHV